jgi:hypothetical protein
LEVKMGSGFTTLTGTTATNKNINVTMTAAQLDALTTVTSGASNGTFVITVSDTGSVTVDLSDITLTAANHNGTGDAITFAAVASTAVATVTTKETLLVIGGAGTADVLNVKASLGAVTMGETAFETVNFITTAQASAVTAPVGATTISSSVAQAGLTIAAATSAVNTSNASGTAAIIDNNSESKSTVFTHTGAGAMTVTMTAETTTAAADTVTSTGTGAITVNQVAASGVTTVNLNSTGSSVDTINLAGTGIGIATSVDRVVVNGFIAANDILALDDDQTTQAGGNTIQAIASAAGTTITTSVIALNYEMGGAANVLGGDLTGATLLINHGAFTVTSGDDGYIIAYDGGNAYLYAFVDTGNTALAASEIRMVGIINGVSVGAIGTANLTFTAS